MKIRINNRLLEAVKTQLESLSEELREDLGISFVDDIVLSVEGDKVLIRASKKMPWLEDAEMSFYITQCDASSMTITHPFNGKVIEIKSENLRGIFMELVASMLTDYIENNLTRQINNKEGN